MTEAERIIQDARAIDPSFDQSVEHARGPGRYEACAENRELAVAIDTIIGHGSEDESAGDTDFLGHFARVGSYVLSTDDRGFRTLTAYETEEEASMQIAEVADAMAMADDDIPSDFDPEELAYDDG